MEPPWRTIPKQRPINRTPVRHLNAPSRRRKRKEGADGALLRTEEGT